jgi:galactoside O-acetyltransferase
MLRKFLRRLHHYSYGVPLRVSAGRQLNFKRKSSVDFGKEVRLGNQNTITAIGGRIILGDYFNSNDSVILNADIGGVLSFGENCLVGPGCIFRTANHKYDNPSIPIRAQGHSFSNICIGNDVWFGANVVVLPGVSLGEGCVVGAGAVVTRDFDKFTILAGVPAKAIGMRKTNSLS